MIFLNSPPTGKVPWFQFARSTLPFFIVHVILSAATSGSVYLVLSSPCPPHSELPLPNLFSTPQKLRAQRFNQLNSMGMITMMMMRNHNRLTVFLILQFLLLLNILPVLISEGWNQRASSSCSTTKWLQLAFHSLSLPNDCQSTSSSCHWLNTRYYYHRIICQIIIRWWCWRRNLSPVSCYPGLCSLDFVLFLPHFPLAGWWLELSSSLV